MTTAGGGASTRRLEGASKVTGRSQYTADLDLYGLAHTRLVLCPHAHAEIVAVDSRTAAAVPGVIAIVSAADLPEVQCSGPDQPLARGRAYFEGQPVIAVVAETASVATDAAALVDVQYQELPALVDLENALAIGASAVLRGPSVPPTESGAHGTEVAGGTVQTGLANVTAAKRFRRGDVDSALATSHVVVTGRYEVPSVQHSAIEPHTAIARFEPDGSWTVWTGTQGLFLTRQEVAQALGVTASLVRVVPMTVGGAFGGKIRLLEPLVCLLSRHVRRPVQLELTRTEEFLFGRGAPGAVIEMEMGADRDGRLLALRATVTFDNGASTGGPGPLGGAACQMIGGVYRCPNLDLTGLDVATNKTPVAAYRAPGAPQAFFALESAMDDVSLALGLDPIEFRVRNASRAGDPLPDGSTWPPIGLLDCLERARSCNLYRSPLMPGEAVGVAVGGWGGGRQPAAALCRVEPDGQVVVLVGSIDISGTDTSLAIIAAETLGVGVESVRIERGDSGNAPVAGMAGGSKTIYTVGAAVRSAATDARRQLERLASERLEVAIEDLEVENGHASVRGVRSRSVSIAQLAALGHDFGSPYPPIQGQGLVATSEQAPMFTVHLAVVAVDPETGGYCVTRYGAIQDVGRALNPAEIYAQIHGGTVQGLGRILGEALVYQDGSLRTTTFLDYGIASADQVPEIEVELVEVPAAQGPFGAKGVGEPPAIPPAAAVANAIARATGVRIRRLPADTEVLCTPWQADRPPTRAKSPIAP